MKMTSTSRSTIPKYEFVEVTFQVPWGIIAAKAWGDPCLSPVIMVHGIQDNAGTFDRMMSLLPDSFYYMCIDLPGHGKSSHFPEGIFFDFLLYVSAIRRVILKLQWSKYCYIGHSFGGQLGAYYTALYPEEVTKLIMLDTLAYRSVSFDDYIGYCQKAIQRMIELETKLLNTKPPNYTYEEAVQRMITSRKSVISREAVEALSKRGLIENDKNFYSFSADQRLKFGVGTPTVIPLHMTIISKIECPVLIIITHIYLHFVSNYRTGKFDYETLELYKKKNNFKIVSVPGNHDVHNVSPEIVAPHIMKFLLQRKSAL